MESLPCPSAGKITHIVHIADVHIRAGDPRRARMHEYASVFANLRASLRNLQAVRDGSAVTVIAGDVFHHKHRIDSPGVQLYYDLVVGLANSMPVYIIMGNHDYRQDDPDIIDLLSALTDVATIPNVFFLKNTGSYVSSNVHFGLLAIQDVLEPGKGSGPRPLEHRCSFPKPSNNHAIDTNVALFHGPVQRAKMANDRSCDDALDDANLFQGYDIAVLGDIHKTQVHDSLDVRTQPIVVDGACHMFSHTWSTDRCCWGYSGSLVQQNFGEPMFGHGFMVWDLAAKQVHGFHVPNEFGMLTTHYSNDSWYFGDIPLRQALQVSWMPRLLSVRVPQQDIQRATQELHDILDEYGKELSSLSGFVSNQRHVSSGQLDSSSITAEFTHSDAWLCFLEQNMDTSDFHEGINWKSWLSAPNEFSIPEPINMSKLNTTSALVSKRNDVILKNSQAVLDCISQRVRSGRQSIQLLRMDWSWIMCYGQDCWFDFAKMNGNVVTLNAKNASGKTAFLETICLALFGRGFPSRTHAAFTSALINLRKPASSKASTCIQFIVGNSVDVYELHRVFDVQKDTNRLTNKTVMLKIKGEQDAIAKDATRTKDWLTTHVGTFESFLISCMLTQQNDFDFFKMSPKQQQEQIGQALSLDATHALIETLRDAKAAHSSVLQMVQGVYDATSAIVRDSHITDQEVSSLEEQVILLSTKKEHVSLALKDQDQLISTLDAEAVALAKSDTFDYENNVTTPDTESDLNDDALKACIDDLQKRLKDLDHVSTTEQLESVGSLADLLESEPTVPSLTFDQCLDILSEYERWKTSWPSEWTCPKEVMTHLEQALLRFETNRDVAAANYNRLCDQEDTLIKSITTSIGVISELHDSRPMFNDQDVPTDHEMYDEASLQDKLDSLTKTEPDVPALSEVDVKATLQEHLRWLELNKDLGDSASESQDNLQEIQALIHKHEQSRPLPCSSTNEDAQTCAQNFLRFKERVYSVLDPEFIVDSIFPSLLLGNAINVFRDGTKEKAQLIVEFDRIQALLNHQDDIPFNPDCEACRKQPWKLQQEQYIAQLNKLKIDIKENQDVLDKYFNNSDIISTWSYLLKEALDLEAQVAFHDARKKQRIELDHWQQRYNELKSSEAKARQSEVQRLLLMISKWSARNEWNSCYDDAMLRLNAKRFLEWKSSLEQATSVKNSIETSLKQVQGDKKEALVKVDFLRQEATKALEAYHRALRFSAEFESNTTAYTNAKNQLKAAKTRSDWEVEVLVAIQRDLAKYQAIQHARLITKVCEAKEALDMQSILTQELKQIDHELNESIINLRILQQKHEVYQVLLKELVEIQRYQETIAQRLQVIQQMMVCMNGFSSWIFKEKICPLLENEVNSVLSASNMGCGASLQTKWLDNDTMTWFMLQNDVSYPLEKASGCQRFMIGLAMRIALSKMGAVDVACRQLFLDEGFVACDADNLTKVPSLLRWLLDAGYHSILLVTHLEDVRESADLWISIKRDDSSNALLQWG
jgi:DNA repair exonuclease SbcCD ATPase subunit